MDQDKILQALFSWIENVNRKGRVFAQVILKHHRLGRVVVNDENGLYVLHMRRLIAQK